MKHITPRTWKKIGVYFILGFFLLSTFLMSAMYFVDMSSQNAQADSGAVDAAIEMTGTVGTGS